MNIQIPAGLGKNDALPLLQKLPAADRYEERPLIWQARLLLDAKKWDAAITVLPSDVRLNRTE